MIHSNFKDLELSSLGFGSMRLPVIDGKDEQIDREETARMVGKAFESGINYFDTAWGYHAGYSETVIELAPEYPDIQFCQTSYMDMKGRTVPSNYHTFKGEAYQGRYVSGIAAGMKIREMISERYILDRKACVADTPYGKVRYKCVTGYGTERFKIEFDDLAAIAAERDISIADARTLVMPFVQKQDV